MTASSPPIDGTCDSAFSAVRDAFTENFRSRDEIGAAVSIRIEGRTVVDLWGGHQDEARQRPWKRDTLVNAYSVGKGVTAMLALALVERGRLDLDAPVVKVWPELGAEGKGRTTLRMILSHRAGLPGVRKKLADDAMLSWSTMTEALAEQAPYWEPGTAHGYHVNSFGFLVGEPIVRRLGMPFSEALRETITGSRAIDYHIGLAAREHPRVADVIEAPRPWMDDPDIDPASALRTGDPEIDGLLTDVYFNPPGLSGFGFVNGAPWRLASIPSTNGHGTARAVAELYDLFLNRDVSRGGLVGRGLRDEATRIHSDGPDRVLGKNSRFGLGFQLSEGKRMIGGSPTGFGHFGYGGSLGFADPETGVGFGYVMNRPGKRFHTPRANALVEALNQSLGRPTPAAADVAAE
jgi:CubicO group peptidase (beta-lactamase class C family)